MFRGVKAELSLSIPNSASTRGCWHLRWPCLGQVLWWAGGGAQRHQRQNAAFAELVGKYTLDNPMIDCVDFHVQVWDFQQFSNPRDQSTFVIAGFVINIESEVTYPFLRFPAPGWAHWHDSTALENSTSIAVDEVAREPFIVPILRQVGAEMGRDHIRNFGRTVQHHTDLWANAFAPVSCYHVLTFVCGLFAIGIVYGRSDTIIVLGEFGHVVREEDPSGVPFLC